MIEFEDVHFSYRDQKILQGISFTIPQGETVAVLRDLFETAVEAGA